MSITMSDTAAKRVKNFFNKEEKSMGLRLLVRTSGCSGMAYVIEIINKIKKEEMVFEDKKVKIIVDIKNLRYIDGTDMDFVQEGLNAGFKFKNPNIYNQCGCGESFNV